jgi:hypothetical protein
MISQFSIYLICFPISCLHVALPCYGVFFLIFFTVFSSKCR